MAFTEADKEAMDAAAAEAQVEFDSILTDVESDERRYGMEDIINWVAKWYQKAGHKRLGRILVAEAKGMKTNKEE